MQFSDLASVAWSGRKRGANLLVSMPVYAEYPVLFEHLSHLRRQTFQGFDLIVVLGNAADEKMVAEKIREGKYGFGIILAKRKEDTGAAGGFFTGQKYGLENGYEFIVNAESDCYPVDSDLLAALWENREKQYAGPYVRQMDGEKVVNTPAGGVNMYCLISARLIRKYGLYFAPMHLGGEDAEYAERIRERKHLVQNFVTHPVSGKNVHRRLERHLLYVYNGLYIERRPLRLANQFFKMALSCLSLALFFRSPINGYATKAASLLLAYMPGREFFGSLKCDYSKIPLEEHSLEKGLRFESVQHPLRYAAGMFASAASNFRREVVVSSAYELTPVFLLAAFAKRTCLLADGGRHLAVSENKSLPAHLLKLAAFLLAFFILLLPLFLAFLLIKLFRQPNTMRFGLEEVA